MNNSAAKHTIKVLSHPFPGDRVPGYQTVCIERPRNGPVGVAFVVDTKSKAVIFSKIAADSPLNATPIGIGHVCLAIKGVPVRTAKEATTMIKQATESVLTFTFAEPCPPMYRMVAAAKSNTNPGVSLVGTRDDTLVAIARVFPQGTFHSTPLEIGDVVLAVNGTAVTDRVEAMNLMRMTKDTIIVLYVLDMEAVRKMIDAELSSRVVLLRDVRLVRTGDQNARVVRGKAGVDEVDLELKTLNVVDPTPYYKLWVRHEGGTVALPQYYVEKTRNFISQMNFILDRQLSALEEAVACQAWQHSLPMSEMASAAVVALRASTCDIPMAEGIVISE